MSSSILKTGPIACDLSNSAIPFLYGSEALFNEEIKKKQYDRAFFEVKILLNKIVQRNCFCSLIQELSETVIQSDKPVLYRNINVLLFALMLENNDFQIFDSNYLLKCKDVKDLLEKIEHCEISLFDDEKLKVTDEVISSIRYTDVLEKMSSSIRKIMTCYTDPADEKKVESLNQLALSVELQEIYYGI